MAVVVLFHSALGLRPAVLATADRLREAGHDVHTPDLYEGRTADNVVEGAEIAQGIGREELLARAGAAVADIPSGAVFAGLSLGATVARHSAGVRGGSALVLLHDSPDDPRKWDGPVVLQAARPDDWVEEDVFDAWAALPGARTWRYPDTSHLYTDPDTRESLPADAAAAELTWQRVLDFLAELEK